MNEHHFYSIDRLVEFGMEMAIASQMINMMNQSMSQMNVAGSTMPNRSGTLGYFYFVLNGVQAGPFSESEVMRLIVEKKLNIHTLAWRPGFTAWQEIQKVPEIMKLVALTPPPVK